MIRLWRRPGDPILILLQEWIVCDRDRVSRAVVLGHVLDLLLLVLNAHQAEGLDVVWLSTSAVPGLGCVPTDAGQSRLGCAVEE